MNVLITGGAGFIGSHLADACIERGDEVFVIDDLSTGSIDNIHHLKGHERFHYEIESVQNLPVLAELVDHCDVIFHLAAAKDRGRSARRASRLAPDHQARAGFHQPFPFLQIRPHEHLVGRRPGHDPVLLLLMRPGMSMPRCM